ncbi:DUF4936 family protein [Calidifontimicrobium sp. SYSU G02091]|uniref:DUF4936 family protein n=1 Tax=Calidifontimicrobium sp. SYSU G02091 TaxID=2926421 RepID=UPI001F53BCCD|nr:DUF4936 family protein [Calidifontimicrobium sp. SYSU G02091]
MTAVDPSARGRCLFVYYRVPAPRLEAAAAAARALQADLVARHPGLEAALLRRPELRDGDATLMETYAAPAGVDDALAAEIARLAAAAGLPQPRHVEVFEPLT